MSIRKSRSDGAEPRICDCQRQQAASLKKRQQAASLKTKDSKQLLLRRYLQQRKPATALPRTIDQGLRPARHEPRRALELTAQISLADDASGGRGCQARRKRSRAPSLAKPSFPLSNKCSAFLIFSASLVFSASLISVPFSTAGPCGLAAPNPTPSPAPGPKSTSAMSRWGVWRSMSALCCPHHNYNQE